LVAHPLFKFKMSRLKHARSRSPETARKQRKTANKVTASTSSSTALSYGGTVTNTSEILAAEHEDEQIDL
jgi:hypothetical protein